MATQPMWGAIDPSIISDQTALDRQQQIAQFLRQQSLTPMGGTEMAGGVSVRRSPLEGMAKLLAGYQAGQMDKSNDAARLALAQKSANAMNQAFSGILGGPQSAPVDPNNMPADAPAMSFPVGSSSQSAPAAQQTTQEQAIRRAAQSAFLMGNTDLANKLVGNLLEMTPEQKNMRATGQDPLEMGRLATAAARKAGIIELQPGTTAVNLADGTERFQPTLAPGVQLQNGVASPVPGFAQANAGIKGAEAQASEGAKMMTVNMPDGSTRQMTQAQYLQLTSPQNRVAKLAAQNGDTNYTYDVGGQQGAVIGQPQGGLGQSANPVAMAAQTEFAKGQAKGVADYGVALNDRVSEGRDLIGRVDEMRNALAKFQPGMGAEARLNIGRAVTAGLTALGMDEGKATEYGNKFANGDQAAMQEFSKVSAQSAMQALKSQMGPGQRMTQAEFKVFLENNPNIALSRPAMNAIFDFMEKQYKKDFSEQQAYDTFVNGQRGDPTRFQAWYSKQMESQRARPVVTPTSVAPKVRKFNPATGMIE